MRYKKCKGILTRRSGEAGGLYMYIYIYVSLGEQLALGPNSSLVVQPLMVEAASDRGHAQSKGVRKDVREVVRKGVRKGVRKCVCKSFHKEGRKGGPRCVHTGIVLSRVERCYRTAKQLVLKPWIKSGLDLHEKPATWAEGFRPNS